MLNKVRLRLLLNNMAVFTVIFSLLFAGIWTLMHRNIVLQTERMLEKTVRGEHWPMPPEPYPGQDGDKNGSGQEAPSTSGQTEQSTQTDQAANETSTSAGIGQYTTVEGSASTAARDGRYADNGGSDHTAGGLEAGTDAIINGTLGRFNFPLSRNAFVLFNTGGTVAAMYGPDSIGADQTEAIARSILSTGLERGIVKVEAVGANYRYYTLVQEDGKTAVAFTDSEVETAVIGSLVSTFLVVGMLSLLCIFVSSWFLTNRALVPIRQAWDRQNRFVADASHELRTPMTAISTNLDVILSCPEDTVSSQQRWFLNIRRAYSRMNTLVDDLLFLARSDAGELTDPVTAFDLKPAFEETLETFEAIFRKNSLSVDAAGLESVELVASEKRIRQVAAILLDNAVKYTHPGGSIRVRCRRDGARCEFEVSDTGIGMAPEHLDRIFERFYRIDPSRSREVGGNGMGLAIAHQIVVQHGGTLSVESTPGEGSTFTVSMPLKGRAARWPDVRRLFGRSAKR